MNGMTKSALGRRWGLRNGYTGREGGWIHSNETGRPVCQGWLRLFEAKRGAIVASLLTNQ